MLFCLCHRVKRAKHSGRNERRAGASEHWREFFEWKFIEGKIERAELRESASESKRDRV